MRYLEFNCHLLRNLPVREFFRQESVEVCCLFRLVILLGRERLFCGNMENSMGKSGWVWMGLLVDIQRKGV